MEGLGRSVFSTCGSKWRMWLKVEVESTRQKADGVLKLEAGIGTVAQGRRGPKLQMPTDVRQCSGEVLRLR